MFMQDPLPSFSPCLVMNAVCSAARYFPAYLALATDLIIFMAYLWTQGIDNQISIINHLMNKWSERVEKSATLMKEQVAEQIAEQSEETTKDVAMILLDINNIQNKKLVNRSLARFR